MSVLFTYKVQRHFSTLRVDDDDLIPLASDIQSVSCVGQEKCSPERRADLVWGKPEGDKTAIVVRGERWEEPFDRDALFLQTQYLLDQLFAYKLSDHLQLHAGTVVSPSGKAWIVCGDSGAGKTSLTLALLIGNWGWLSDEYALFNEMEAGTVFSFPRNFNIKEHSFPHFPETAGLKHGREIFSQKMQKRIRFVDPSDLQRGVLLPKAELGGFIFPRYEPNGKASGFSAISSLETANRLLTSAMNVPAWGPALLARAVQSAPAYTFSYEFPRDIIRLAEPIL